MSDNIVSGLPKAVAVATFALAASAAAVHEEYDSRNDDIKTISVPASNGKVMEVSSLPVTSEASL